MEKRKSLSDRSGEPVHKTSKLADCPEARTLLNPVIFDSVVKEKFADAFKHNQGYEDEKSKLCFIADPFPCCVVPNMFADRLFVDDLKYDLLGLNFHNKSNDLYKFKQSDDLKKNSSKRISLLRSALFEHFRKWLEEATQINLNSTVDLSCAKYEYTDVLLCHDDELEGRRIAFIYYLTPDSWQASDGGLLDLFSMDDKGQPTVVSRSITPASNSLVFFEVTPKSFHQVSEVLSRDKLRLSISGWFHGQSVERPIPHLEPHPPTFQPIFSEDEILLSWLNPTYLNPEIVSSIQEQFEENSEIQLNDFLLEDKYLAVCEELQAAGVRWSLVGPPNKRCYRLASCESLPPAVGELVKMFRSLPMFKLLKKFTDLDLAKLDSESEEDGGATPTARQPSLQSVCSVDVRRWQHGSYTLVHDGDPCGEEYALDAILYFCCDDWDSSMGGFTSYLANGEDEELLTVYPSSNCLSLVYRDRETIRFVKHVNDRSNSREQGASGSSTTQISFGSGFYDISMTYFE